MYPQVIVKEDLRKWALDWVTAHPLGQRGYFDGTPAQQRDGLIMQMETYRFFLDEYPVLKIGNDGGIDFEFNERIIDVKGNRTNYFSRPLFRSNMLASQVKAKADTIFFCNYHLLKNIVEFLGWVPKKKLCTPENFSKKDTLKPTINGGTFKVKEDSYFIQNSELNDPETLKIRVPKSYVQLKLF